MTKTRVLAILGISQFSFYNQSLNFWMYSAMVYVKIGAEHRFKVTTKYQEDFLKLIWRFFRQSAIICLFCVD